MGIVTVKDLIEELQRFVPETKVVKSHGNMIYGIDEVEIIHLENALVVIK